MQKALDGRVAVVAAQSVVDAGRMLGAVNRDAFALADVIPAWPWQARQLSSCLSGWAIWLVLEPEWAPARRLKEDRPKGASPDRRNSLV